MSDILIRPAQPDDAPALATLGARTFLDTFVGEFAIPYPADDLEAHMRKAFSVAAFAELLADPACRTWIAKDASGAPVGYGAVGPNSLPHPEAMPGETELYRLYVDRSRFGSGLGARLMDVALAHLDPAGTARVWLGVWSGNHRAQAFYARYGFRKVGDYKYPVGRWLDDEFIFRRG
jgi:ribosomal protein S18 acetylase RimI-like enzyme